MTQFVERRIAAHVLDRLGDEPVVALQGPRIVGKSTLLAEVARRHGVEVIDLDQPSIRNADSSFTCRRVAEDSCARQRRGSEAHGRHTATPGAS